ncbi:hypothetical protein Ae331Ps2_5170c [Pseudonocardia sp. Ae331_Ps2]|nr:hypothetical protein Ae331Ps2_5170c [Pseudonocardia sp. Ae331_Ps2]
MRARAAARPVRRDRRRGVGRIALPGRRGAARPAHRPAGARRPRGRRALGAPLDRPADALGRGGRGAAPDQDECRTARSGPACVAARRAMVAGPGGDRAAGPARPRPVADRSGAAVRQGAAGDPGGVGVGADRPGCGRGDLVVDPRPRRRACPTGAGRRPPGRPAAHRRLLRERLRRHIARIGPDGARERHERARSERRMSVSPGDDGMGSLWLGGTAAQVEASWQCVDRLARSLDDPCDDRTLDQKRVDLAHQLLQGTLTLTDVGTVRDALGAAAEGAEDGTLLAAVAQVLAAKPDPGEVVGRRPLIQVVVPLSTLMGGAAPAELVGHGPIPADLARAFAAGSVWQRLVTDPLSGMLLDVGRTRYRPPVAMADHVRARDGTCRGPACSRRVRDLDHHRPWAAGNGPTSAENLFGLCRADHALKDAPGWQVLAGRDGSLTWVAPCGRRATTQPFDYRAFTDPLPSGADHGADHGAALVPF